MKLPLKIAVAGTHSTGKTTFVTQLKARFVATGLEVACVHDSAEDARDIGFPILKDHTFDSTAWLIAQAIRLETVAALSADVILVDRPVPDALGYLVAALRITGRAIELDKLARLDAICVAWIGEYDLIFVTELDATIPIGPGRDDDQAFRVEVGEAISELLDRLAPDHHKLRPENGEMSLDLAMRIAAAI